MHPLQNEENVLSALREVSPRLQSKAPQILGKKNNINSQLCTLHWYVRLASGI